ncbi:MAG: hypothetical protein AAF636_20850, partial [Pseudomonadota bacterium]
ICKGYVSGSLNCRWFGLVFHIDRRMFDVFLLLIDGIPSLLGRGELPKPNSFKRFQLGFTLKLSYGPRPICISLPLHGLETLVVTQRVRKKRVGDGRQRN